MSIKRSDSFEEFQRKQTAKRALESPPLAHNQPNDLPTLSHEEHSYVDAAREALATMKRTFEFWIVIARGLQSLKDKADRIGGRFTFDRLREREGLGGRRRDGTDVLNKTRVSRLLAILDNLPEIEAWRQKLTSKQQFDWASPEAVYRHCPVFTKPKEDIDDEKPLTPAQKDRQALAAALEENHKLKQREDGDTFNPKTTSARDIAVALIGQLQPYAGKAAKVAHEMLALLGTQVKPKTSSPAR